MPLPAYLKTWQFSVNNARPEGASALIDAAGLLVALKNQMKGFAQNPWTVRYSCNVTTVGVAGDGVDWWDSAASLTWATADTGSGGRSWIVLRNVDGLEVLLECRNAASTATGHGIRVVMSPSAGFTGGTATSRPTATDEIVLLLGANTTLTTGSWGAGTVSGTVQAAFVWHMWHSSDGQVTMGVICSGGLPSAFFYFGRVSEPSTGWALPYVGIWMADNQNLPFNAVTYDGLFDGAYAATTNPRVGARFPAGNFPIWLMSEAENNGTRTSTTNHPHGRNVVTVNQITGEWETSQVGVACHGTGAKGKHGKLFDVRFVSTGLSTGDTGPVDGSRTAVVFGHLALPWNGTVPQTA